MDSGPSCSLLANISFISEVTLEFEVYSTDSSSPISKKMSGGMGAQASQLSQLQYLSGRAQSTIWRNILKSINHSSGVLKSHITIYHSTVSYKESKQGDLFVPRIHKLRHSECKSQAERSQCSSLTIIWDLHIVFRQST